MQLPQGGSLERLNWLGLRSLRSPHRRELDALVLRKAAVTVSLDGGVVHEDVGAAVVRGDETEALISVEPLHRALSHVLFLLLQRYSGTSLCASHGRRDRPLEILACPD